MNPAVELARSLSALVDEEFEALKARDLDRFERLQPAKLNLLEKLSEFGSPVGDAPGLPPEAIDLIRRARDAHRRNETLMQHQLDALRGALQALTADSSLDPVEVYDRLGNVQGRRGGRGYRDA